MQVAIEISLYPLQQDYEPPVKAFIHALRVHTDLRISTNELSTQISGDYDRVMEVLTGCMRPILAEEGARSFVLKILNVEIETGTQVEV